MKQSLGYAGVMMLAAVAASSQEMAQTAAPAGEVVTASVAEAAPAPAESDETPLIDVPGGEIVVLGDRIEDLQRAATQVVSVLSSEDIARTGEGDIAGALSHLTGLSLVGGGFVYVRGLGDRYSQALLNGLPLPSPEPLRRAVPLDLFPTDVIASSLVQKTYSANLPGEFGGGLINLTTLGVARTPFLSVSVGASGDTESSGRLGYDYYGGKSDWTGYDNGSRDTPPALQAFFASGEKLSAGRIDSVAIARQFVRPNNVLLQKVNRMPANLSGSISGARSWLLGDATLGVIATAGTSSKWRTRDMVQQTPGSFDLSVVDKDYREVSSENRIVNNALLGLTYEFGMGNRVRWTNLYVHDTLKRSSLAEGRQNGQRTGQDFQEQGTGWYERQLVNSQLNGSFKFERVNLDVRAAYATSTRTAPFEINIGYSRSNQAASPYGAYFINRLDNGQTGFARVAFSDLDEKLWSAGADLSGRVFDHTVLTLGVDASTARRNSARREFQLLAPADFPSGVALLRPDYLLGTAVIDYYRIGLVETTESDPAFTARLRTGAVYAQAQAELAQGVEIGAGVRYERGQQEVRPRQVFTTPSNSGAFTTLERNYVLPAVTLTYKFRDNMQLRGNVSKTLARPQFRELMFQTYFDPEANRAYRGNPLLVDSDFLNAEARYEWYFAEQQHFSAAGFYKRINRPIEAFTGFNDNTPVTSFANAPQAHLYGLETELERHLSLGGLARLPFLASRRLVLIGNYTYTRSRLKVQAADTVSVFGTAVQSAANFFVNGSPLTGQSDHLANLQLGLESSSRMSQQTLMLNYASNRVTSRGPAGLPDIYESPGLTVDLVAREGFSLFGRALELKLEGRNLLRRGYSEYQERNGNRIYFSRYATGASFSASVSTSF